MTKIEVFCGFLESGKTTLIQHVLEQDYMQHYRRILVIQCEEGEADFRAGAIKNEDTTFSQIRNVRTIRAKLFETVKKELDPDLILMEYNGTWPIERLLQVRLPDDYKIDRIIFCADAETFDLYMKNTGSLMRNQLSNADSVHFNRCSGDLQPLTTAVANVNRTAKLFFEEEPSDRYLAAVLDPQETAETRRLERRRHVAASLGTLFVCLLIVGYPILKDHFSVVQSINMVFIGIIMQAVPFLLIGAFVSSLLQVFVPDDVLVRFFTGHRWLGFPLALILGFFFPVCDCGIVPIASRLTRKGVPLPHAMAFMLAAPAVSPVAILSTVYAFPGQPSFVLFRVLIGILIAALAGAVLLAAHAGSEQALLPSSTVSCACSVDTVPCKNKAELIFVLTGKEFITMGKYIVVGALLCAVLQQSIPASLFQKEGASAIVPLLVMLLLAFFMSVCSTSNAFIARSFLNVFPVTSVIAFMVMGPMLDLSNLFMLTGTFKKRFVVKLVGLLLILAVPIFLLLSVMIQGGMK